jgi:hypothetical protein
MSDYIKHIAHDCDFPELKGKTWCGREVEGFAFVDIDHAAYNGRNEGRLVACKSCVAAVLKALQNGH